MGRIRGGRTVLYEEEECYRRKGMGGEGGVKMNKISMHMFMKLQIILNN